VVEQQTAEPAAAAVGGHDEVGAPRPEVVAQREPQLSGRDRPVSRTEDPRPHLPVLRAESLRVLDGAQRREVGQVVAAAAGEQREPGVHDGLVDTVDGLDDGRADDGHHTTVVDVGRAGPAN
jgi:hypothetical protein